MINPTNIGAKKPVKDEIVFIIEKTVAANSDVISATIGMSPPDDSPIIIVIKTKQTIAKSLLQPANGIPIRKIPIEQPPAIQKL